MSNIKIGQGYFGCADKVTSTENQEIIQAHKPETWTTTFNATKLHFKTFADCHVKINGGDAIFLEANQVFQTDYTDKEINTFVVVEADKAFIYWFCY
jgi:hypothetical protein